ncbi:MAG: hypothetical protein CMJ49_01765 [Planctomycetaceae bacterium]|nr:hypothetical protein [Planctomycetaceae bacterium]
MLSASRVLGQRRGRIIAFPFTVGSTHVPTQRRINSRYCTAKLRADYAHVGLHDVKSGETWIARRRLGVVPIRISHARMLHGGSDTTSVAEKDHFLCYWYHTPGTGEGPLHGYPIEWEEGHLMVRLDPNWNHQKQALIRQSDTAKVERNIDRQYVLGQKLFDQYVALGPKFPLSWHMIGPRPADSMFYVQRVEPGQ